MSTKPTQQLIVHPYRSADKAAVIQLWRNCALVVPQNDPEKDITRKLRVAPDLFLIATIRETVIATVMAGYDGHRGWINYLAVTPAMQKQGIGRRMMKEAEQRLKDIGCPKINLQVRGTNAAVIKIYERLGFSVDPVVSMGKRLIPDEPFEDTPHSLEPTPHA